MIAEFVRGLSTRDVEATLAEALGPEARVSRSTVSRICEAIKQEFDAFKARDLSGIELEYLFLDGRAFRMHQGSKAEPVLVAWGIDTAGKPHLLGLQPGSAESTDACSPKPSASACRTRSCNLVRPSPPTRGRRSCGGW